MQDCRKNIYIGEVIRERLKELGKSVSSFSRELSCSRANVYLIFKKHTLDTELLMRTSIILDYDFFRIYSTEFNNRKLR